jgi:hypothetical protein
VLSVIGVLSPAVQALAALTQIAPLGEPWPAGALLAGSAAASWHPMPMLVIATSLLLLGPGAYSVDAYWFGRREISIPQSMHRRVE